jgi:hypothetical protein
MVDRGSHAFGRWARLALAVVVLVFAATSLAAQGTTGKVEGTVTDPTGQPVAGAQVLVRGTSLGAVTNSAGYWFINSVPAGTYTLMAVYIGFQPNEVRNVVVRADQTLTVNFALQSAVELGAITISVSENPIVPRDQVATKTIVSGQLVQDLPVDNIRQVLALTPGVVESGNFALSIRGGRPGEAVVYVDGAPVRRLAGDDGNFGSRQQLQIGTNALEEASVTTGALGAEFGDAQSGIIAYVTRAGGPTFDGSVSYETDEAFNNNASLGFNRVEASLGGPIMGNLTFFLSGTIQGQQSDVRGKGVENYPTYVLGGLDTVVTDIVDDQEAQIEIPRFVQFSGQCDASDNFGFECQGRRAPYNWSAQATATGKLQYTYGSGSRVSATLLRSQDQFRNAMAFGTAAFAPQRASGTRQWSNALIMNWTQQISRSAERALAFDANLSYQTDKQIRGIFTRDYEVNNRSPWAGFGLSPMEFVVDFDHFSDDTPDMYPQGDAVVVTQLKSQDDWDRLVRNIRSNRGTRLPYLNRADLRNSQPYRMNPYGLTAGFQNEGLDHGVTLLDESRLTGRANVDWQFDRYNRFRFGGDMVRANVNWVGVNVRSQIFQDAYTESPVRYGFYGEDRLDLGDVVLELGVRWDYFDTGALLPETPGRIYTMPGFNPDNPDSLLVRAESHATWSPRVRVSFPVTDRTNFRLSYSHQVQSPDFTFVLSGINNDLAITNTNDVFGRDVTWGKSILFEFGIRHAFTQDLVFDLSAYNKDKVSDLANRTLPFFDPVRGDTINLNVVTNADFGNVRGMDMALTTRAGNLLNGQLGYTFQLARSTGSDPDSYLNTLARSTTAVLGERVDPPQAVLPTDDNRTHTITGALSLTFPNDFEAGPLTSVVRDLGAFLRFRFASGLPYTRLVNTGSGSTAPFVGFGLNAQPSEPINSSAMPWIQELDLRVTKGLRLGGLAWTAYADFRNLLNLSTITGLFAETGDVRNDEHRVRQVESEVTRLLGSATAAQEVTEADGSITVVLPGNCSDWSEGAVNCVLIKRAEQRWGNGDGRYTEQEYMSALNAYYDLVFPVRRFYAPGRQIRLGLQLQF